jgi:hypothetical protein
MFPGRSPGLARFACSMGSSAVPHLDTFSPADGLAFRAGEVRIDPAVLRAGPTRAAPIGAPVTADPPLDSILACTPGVAGRELPALGTADVDDPDVRSGLAGSVALADQCA